MKIFLYDPVTKRYLNEVDTPEVFPPNCTTEIPPAINGAPVYYTETGWSFDDPNTPEIETPYPVLQIQNIAISNSRLDDAGIWNVKTKTILELTATTLLPAGEFTAIIQKVVNKQPIDDIRYDATITVDGGQSLLSLPLYFEESGNYTITAERLNKGLAEINRPFRVAFPTVDINVTVKIPT
jgi:hypothetical protein